MGYRVAQSSGLWARGLVVLGVLVCCMPGAPAGEAEAKDPVKTGTGTSHQALTAAPAGNNSELGPVPSGAESVEGRWLVHSVELAGLIVPGLAGTELTLSKGKKTFKLPTDVVEKGSYRLRPTAKPAEIDTTTEGRDGVEKGIFAVEGGTLRICLATRGGARPTEFATREGTDLMLITLRRGPPAPAERSAPLFSNYNHYNAGIGTDAAPARAPTGTRRFRMGFTGFVYDITPEAVAASRKFVRENGDILAHHIEGVPWGEALSGRPFPEAVLEEWEGKKAATPLGGKVYLAISPGRGELKVMDKTGPLPKELAGKTYDDPLVMKAYLNYCRRAVEFFEPDYLAIGIEVNEIYRDGGPKKWDAYVALHQYIYKELKRDHKDLPIFASWTLHQMFQQRGGMLEAFQQADAVQRPGGGQLLSVLRGRQGPSGGARLDDRAIRCVQEAVRDGGDQRRGRAVAAAQGGSRHRGHTGKAGGLLPQAAGDWPRSATSRSSSASSIRTTMPCGRRSRTFRRSCSWPGATAACSTRTANRGRRMRSGRSISACREARVNRCARKCASERGR